MSGATNAAKDSIRKSDISTLRKALLAYNTLNGSYPVATCADINSGCTDLSNALIPGYLGILPSDPNSASSYSYTSTDGTDSTVAATLSNATGYSYTASTGFGEEGGGSPSTSYSACTLRNSNATVQADACLPGEVLLGVSNFPNTSTCDYISFGTDCNSKKTITVAGVERTYSIRAISYCRNSTSYSCAYSVATDALGTNTYIGQNTSTHTLYQTVAWGTSGGWAIVLDGSTPLIAPWAAFGCPNHGLLSCVGNNSVGAPCNYAYNAFNALCCVE